MGTPERVSIDEGSDAGGLFLVANGGDGADELGLRLGERTSQLLDGRLAERGLAADGPKEQVHVRPWATAIRIPTTDGAVWFKASVPALAARMGIGASSLTATVRTRAVSSGQ